MGDIVFSSSIIPIKFPITNYSKETNKLDSLLIESFKRKEEEKILKKRESTKL